MKMGGGNEELNEEKINLTVAYVGCITSDDNMEMPVIMKIAMELDLK